MGIKKTYNIQEISTIINGELFCNSVSLQISNLLIDSRKILLAENSLFFALTGKNHNGHHYIKELYDKGVINFVVSNHKFIQKDIPANFILVKDTLNALQTLTAHHRHLFNLPIIGITGSNGKTIVKEWLFQLISKNKNIIRSPKSYNSQVGVPLSVWELAPYNDLGIFEAGISEINEMDNLQKIICPQIGIFTNIGVAHSENFKDIDQKIDEKLKLFASAQSLVFCQDHISIKNRIKENSYLKNINLFTWGSSSEADIIIKNIETKSNKTEINVAYKEEIISFTIPFIDAASIDNALHCFSTLILLGYPSDLIRKRMSGLSPIEMRLELINGINNCSLINDCYSLDLNSLEIALDFLNQQKQNNNKTIIISDIIDSLTNTHQLLLQVSNMLKEKGIKKVIAIGNKINDNKNLFQQFQSYFYKTTDEFIAQFDSNMFANEIILIKGARIFEFEKISKLLQHKSHQTVLEINLNAFVNNLNVYRSYLKDDTKIMAMVKAFSYGNGSFEIANLLEFNRIDYLGVAYTDEGVELRKAGIKTPILVMSAEEGCFDLMIKHNLEPEIFSIRMLNIFYNTLKKNLTRNTILPYPIHLKIDTGMHRLGFEQKDIKELLDILSSYKELKVKSIFSHLAGSDEASLSDFTKQQLELFDDISNNIISELGYRAIRHILNSSGIINYPKYQFDMVRLGIGLYGIDPSNNIQAKLHNVSSLKTNIVQIKDIKEGDSVGYSRSFIASKKVRVATIPIGYADGISRKYGNNRGKVYVNGTLAPIIGNICMDMCMIDITGIGVKEGDEVILFGKEISISDVAYTLETIPYEVLTNISTRVKRIYYYE